MNTKEMIAVMQAHLDGKQIEIQIHGLKGWAITTCPQWNWGECDYRIEQTKKVVDLSVLIAPEGACGIDCEFWDTGTEEIIHIGKLIAASNVYEMVGCVFQNCRPRMNHIHAWQGGECPLPFNTMVRIHYRDYVRANESYVKRAGDCYWEHRKEPHGLDIIAFEVIGLADGYCYPWECDE